MDSIFPNAEPESQGISSAALWHMLDVLEEHDLQVTGMKLLVNSCNIFEFCKKPYESEGRQLWYSVTKAFTGIGIGIACDKGLLSLDDAVISFFPEKLPKTISVNLRNMQIRHLLSMTGGIHENTYADLYPQEDWIQAFLAQDFPHKPGTYFRYSTHASHMLAAIAEKVTGVSFLHFIRENLLLPLGIDEVSWEVCTQGVTCGGMGLSLSREAVTRFGYMLLHEGCYMDKRIVSRQYLSQALTEQANNRITGAKRHKNGYGFHMCIDQDNSFYHEGAFGQLCYVSPRQQTVLVVNARKNNWDAVINLFQQLFTQPSAPISRVSHKNLQNRLDKLAYPVPQQGSAPAEAFPIGNKMYQMFENNLGLRKIQFLCIGKQQKLHLDFKNRPPGNLHYAFTTATVGLDCFIKDVQYHLQKYKAYVAWQNAATLLITVFYIETPYEISYQMQFHQNRITVHYHANVSFGITDCLLEGLAVE